MWNVITLGLAFGAGFVLYPRCHKYVAPYEQHVLAEDKGLTCVHLESNDSAQYISICLLGCYNEFIKMRSSLIAFLCVLQ